MRCSNCGKDIPTHGTVCPWCKIDKTPDKMVHGTANALGAVGGLVGASLGGVANDWFFGMLVGVFIGYIAGRIVGTKQAEKYKADQRRHQMLAENTRLEKQANYIGNATANALQPPPRAFSPDPEPATPNIASIAREQEASLLGSGDYRKCPHCAELIKSEAKICRFCRIEVAVPIGATR